jgi:hypothetical protein
MPPGGLPSGLTTASLDTGCDLTAKHDLLSDACQSARLSQPVDVVSSDRHTVAYIAALGAPIDQDDCAWTIRSALLESIRREVIIAIQRAHVHASEAGGQPIGGIVAI